MLENISSFISTHNANISNQDLLANQENLSAFALEKNISLTDLSIEKHRMPFINWCTGLAHQE